MRGERDKFLSRIKQSLPRSLLPGALPDHPGSFQGYTFLADAPPERLIEDFTRELNALSGYVHCPATAAGVVTAILEILRQRDARQIIAWDEAGLEPPGLLAALAEAGIQRQESRLSSDRAQRQARLAELDGVPVGLSGAQGGLADTGSLALISGPGRSRLASLLPPVHIALLPVQKLYPSLPAFLAAHSSALDEGSNLVFITGPSRTGDIEMTLSMGVHGPREVHAIIVP